MPGINFDRKKISRPRSTGYLLIRRQFRPSDSANPRHSRHYEITQGADSLGKYLSLRYSLEHERLNDSIPIRAQAGYRGAPQETYYRILGMTVPQPSCFSDLPWTRRREEDEATVSFDKLTTRGEADG